MSWFHVLTVVNNVARGLQIFVQDSDFISFEYMSMSVIAGSYSSTIFFFFFENHCFP